MSLVLAVSTSSTMDSVALVKSGSVLAERVYSENGMHSKTLLPMIDELMHSFAVEISELDYLAVDTGPGSFTGVRVGVSAVNGLAAGANKPVIGVNALRALRFAAQDSVPVATIIDAHNNNVYAAVYYNCGALIEPAAMTIFDLINKLPRGVLCIGDGASVHQKLLAENVNGVRFGVEGSNLLRASYVGLAAHDLIKSNKELIKEYGADFAEPTYLKPSQAEMKQDKKDD